MAKKRLGEILLERGLIDVDQLNSALAYQRQWGTRLGAALVAKRFISEGTLTRALSESLQIPMVDLAKVVVDRRALALLRASTCEQYDVFPIAVKSHKGRNTLLLAMADPLNVAAIDEVAFTTDMTVRPAIAQISSLHAAVKRYYHNVPGQIPPLSFDKPSAKPAAKQDGDGDETMTIIARGGVEERVIGPGGEVQPVVELTDEVTDRHALAEMEMQLARYRREKELRAGQVPGVSVADPFTSGAIPAQTDPFAQVPDAPDVPAYMAQPTTGAFEAYHAQPTGSYMVPAPPMPAHEAPAVSSDVLEQVRSSEADALEALEKKFWALMRVLARRGVVTKDEFLEELSRGD